jgi:tripartite-type tricarboxylate transporter receptor subunit TctC
VEAAGAVTTRRMAVIRRHGFPAQGAAWWKIQRGRHDMKAPIAMLIALAIPLAAGVAAGRAVAQDAYPSRTVKLVLPVAAGSATDAVARVIANKLTKTMGQPIVVENMPGAGLNLGATHAARAEPDGYTLLVAPMPPLTVNNLLYRDLQYQPSQFVPIAMLVQVPNTLAVNNDTPAKTVQEFIAHAKSNPGKLTYGSQGLGSSAHLTMRLFESRAGIEMTHVPYRGEVPVLNDIVAGHINAFFGTLSTALPLYKAQKLKLLAVGGTERSRAVDLPTMAESGLPGFRSTSWFALVGPPGTPIAVVQKVNREVVAALNDGEVRATLDKLTLEPLPGSPADAAKFIARETEQWTEVIKNAGIPVQ